MRRSRRTFLKRASESTLAGLMLGLPKGWVGTAYADDAPETKTVRFGMIALTDCSPIVMAHELGYFKKFGVESIVSKEASWAVIRDKLSLGENQATHMLLGMPLASTMGLAGLPVKPMIIPWLLNRNGQAITLNNKLKQAGVKTAKDLKPIADKAKASGTPLTFAMTFPPGTHALWMRYWLASGGINPDQDVSLIVIPPPQMVANMKVDKMDGFCVGEPWNLRAIQDGIGFTAITTQQMWRDHPEKVCAFTEEFVEVLARQVQGLESEDGQSHPHSKRGCNYPDKIFARWFLSQFRRWGLVKGTPDYAGIANRVMRPDIYLEAMKELGVSPKVSDLPAITLWDGSSFDGKDPEKYARSFPIHSMAAA